MERESVLIDKNPKEFWQKTANEIEGEFKLSKQGLNAGVMLLDYYHLRIFKNYSGINIELHSTFGKSPAIFDEFSIDSLRIESILDGQDKFYLYIWRKGFLEKLFSRKRSELDLRNFYKEIGYETNRKREVELLFSRKDIQDLILEQQISVFNVQFVDKKLVIKYQSNQIIRDKEILLTEYLKYIKFIDGLLEMQLIKPLPVINAIANAGF